MNSTTFKQQTYDELNVHIFASSADLAAAAASDLAGILQRKTAGGADASIIVATGNSQLDFLAALVKRNDIEWSKVRVFHMDEYLGMSAGHPASFRRYLHERLVDIVHPKEFYGVEGDVADPNVEIARYTDLLRRYPADACAMGIGENGHLAFNDPPADFTTKETLHIVTLDEACRRQQVGEGHFATMADVPAHAFSLTVPALMRAAHLLVITPEERKAKAVKAALTGPIGPQCPASILRRQSNAVLYLDPASASLL